MGTSHSTRKITLVNDDKAGVIKLSESLAYRLRGQIEASGAADTTSEKIISGSVPSVPEIAGVTAAVELPEKTDAESQADVGVAVRAGSGPTLSQPGGNIPPWSIYAEEAHLMVMRLREEKEQELQQLNRDWREKMEAREQEFSKMAQLSEDEVNSAIKEVEKLFVKASCTPVCQDHQEAVMTCYQDHPRQALRCARQVEDFARCVDLSRLQSVLRQRAN